MTSAHPSGLPLVPFCRNRLSGESEQRYRSRSHSRSRIASSANLPASRLLSQRRAPDTHGVAFEEFAEVLRDMEAVLSDIAAFRAYGE